MKGREQKVDARERLRQLLIRKALRKGTFRLSSGKISPYYYDGKMVTLDPEGISLIAELVHAEAQKLQIDAIGGLEMGSIPIATAVSQRSWNTEKPIRAFSVRKATKEHGTEKRIEGLLTAGDRVLIVDDVVTTGFSLKQAIAEVERVGGKVVEVLVVVDRLEGGQESLKPHELRALFTRRDLGITDEYLAQAEEASSERAAR